MLPLAIHGSGNEDRALNRKAHQNLLEGGTHILYSQVTVVLPLSWKSEGLFSAEVRIEEFLDWGTWDTVESEGCLEKIDKLNLKDTFCRLRPPALPLSLTQHTGLGSSKLIWRLKVCPLDKLTSP